MTDSQIPTLDVKRKQWLDVLSGKDPHAIFRQLTQMSWDAASYRIVNEARRLAPPAPEGGVQLNGLVHSLIDRGFFTCHIATVRRLMDDSYPLHGKKGVYSLAALLKDMQDCRQLLTRKNIFGAENLAYDYEPIRQKCDEYEAMKASKGKPFFLPPGLLWQRHEERHKVIDALTGTTAQDRQPDDTIQEIVFANLRSKAQTACKNIIDHATKFIAHAATPESRALVKADEASLTLGHLWTAHKHLCEVTGFLAIHILGGPSFPFLPAPQFDQFKYMNRPLIDSSQIGQLQQLWKAFQEDCRKWSQWDLDAYAEEFP